MNPVSASPRTGPTLLRVAGEGALAGLLTGLALGAWEVRLGQDLAHGLPRLAAERLLRPLLPLAASGILAALLLAGLARPVARRGRLPRGAAALCFVLGGLALAWATTGPWRDLLFPLAAPSTPRLRLFAMTAALLPGLLLIGRHGLGLLLRAGGRGPRWQGVPAAAGLAGVLLAALSVLLMPLAQARHAAGRPSIIVVSLDTLRADRPGFMRADGLGLTPRLDALAREGVVFDAATAAAPWTLPSHVSLFTSLLPFDHHVRWSSMRIHPERCMLAERLRDAGYRTAAFTGGGYVSATFGFDQGFEHYEDHDEIVDGGPERLTAAAVDWMRQRADEPFFVFLHTYEPHTPYVRGASADAAVRGRLPPVLSFAEVEAIHRGDIELDPTEQAYVRRLYDADVEHTDRVVGGALSTLRDSGILDRAILIVLSDHGEDLWDHYAQRSPGHGHSLYEELVRVPLFARFPNQIAAGVRVQEPVSLLDIAPTLLALAGLPPDAGHAGRDLSAVLRSGAEPARVAVRSESVEYGPDRFALRLGPLKVILTPHPEKAHHNVQLPVRPLEVFDLAADPFERNDLAEQRIEAARPMVQDAAARARDRLRVGDGPEGTGGDIPEALQRQLRSLGYIQ